MEFFGIWYDKRRLRAFVCRRQKRRKGIGKGKGAGLFSDIKSEDLTSDF